MISKISICLEVGPEATGAFVPDWPWLLGIGANKGEGHRESEDGHR